LLKYENINIEFTHTLDYSGVNTYVNTYIMCENPFNPEIDRPKTIFAHGLKPYYRYPTILAYKQTINYLNKMYRHAKLEKKIANINILIPNYLTYLIITKQILVSSWASKLIKDMNNTLLSIANNVTFSYYEDKKAISFLNYIWYKKHEQCRSKVISDKNYNLYKYRKEIEDRINELR
jgi:hypothetical protein